MKIILYSKPGCHLCEGLQEKLAEIQTLNVDLEVRDITSRTEWFEAFQYEIPVLFWVTEQNEEIAIPRPSPRASVAQLEHTLQKFLQGNRDLPT